MLGQFQIHVPSVMMMNAPAESAERVNELLYGETVDVLEQHNEWVLVRSSHDEYVAFIPMSVLGKVHQTSHRVNVPSTHMYEDPDFKSSYFSSLYMNSVLSATQKRKNGFRELQHGGWIFDTHLQAEANPTKDFVATALKFEHAPYVWGGRTIRGLDCSGLVQIALMAANVKCPRDTKDQIKSIGQSVEFGDTIHYAQLQRGDFVFFNGHVGIMLDADTILNATARCMRVTVEPLDKVIQAYDGIIAVRRLQL